MNVIGKNTGKLSLAVLFMVMLVFSWFRLTHVSDKEISWDVLGYYLYLPATFIHHDPLLTDISWLKALNEEKELAGTLYMVSENDQGEPMYFFLMGMAIFYLPFFFAGNVAAMVGGFPVDGFSLPFQYALVMGGLIYTFIGLFYLRKILRSLFSDHITALVMIILVAGTNYVHHLTLDNLATVNVLFMLNTIVVWHTLQWHRYFHNRHLVITGMAITLMTLVKPSEVFALLIPVLWGVTSWRTLREKLLLVLKQRKALIVFALIALVLVFPQMYYWFIKTGSPVYDSYKNPGVGLDFLSPHLGKALFSYRKGWLLYTPVMILALAGWVSLYRNHKSIFYSLAAYFGVSFYVMASWTEYWYGAGFSCRPVIAAYPVLAIAMGSFLHSVLRKKGWGRIAVFLFLLLAIALNQFQWWQFRNYILDPYRTTGTYYWRTFLKTSVSPEDAEWKLVYRDFSGKDTLSHPERYRARILVDTPYVSLIESPLIIVDSLDNKYVRMDKETEFFPVKKIRYRDLTSRDHAWIRITLQYSFSGYKPEIIPPCLVTTMERSEGVYGYRTWDLLPSELSSDGFLEQQVLYLTPEIRSGKDYFHSYIWKRGPYAIDLLRVRVEVLEIP